MALVVGRLNLLQHAMLNLRSGRSPYFQHFLDSELNFSQDKYINVNELDKDGKSLTEADMWSLLMNCFNTPTCHY